MIAAEDAAPPDQAADRSFRFALFGLLAGAAVLFLLGITWGLPSWRGWAGDEIRPNQVAAGFHRAFSGGWHTKYPPLHFYVLAIVQTPLRALAGIGPVPGKGLDLNSWLFVLSRLMSVAMALGAVAAIAEVGRSVSNPRAGLFAGALVAPGAPFVYFAKTANVEMPFLFWFALSLVFFVRLLDRHRMRDYLWFGACAVFAITSKDQAYGLYLLVPFAVLPGLIRARAQEGARPGLFAALVDRRILSVLGLGLGLAAVIYNWPFNLGGFLAHVRTLLGPQSEEAKAFANTPAGHLGNLVENLSHLRFCMGWPAFAAGAIGAVHAVARARQRERTLLLSLALLGGSYYLFFLLPILFSRDRYVLPLALLLALPAGRLLAAITFSRRATLRGLGLLAAASVLAYGGLYALSVDRRMVHDARYDAEAFARENGGPADSLALGRAKHAPRLPHAGWGGFPGVLARRAPEIVAVNVIDLRTPAEHAAYEKLLSGELGYFLAKRFEWRSRWDILDTQGTYSSLVFVNPEMALFRRDPSLPRGHRGSRRNDPFEEEEPAPDEE
ncbi:MAG TPA: glycosyltransferase family 39 protein [Thermoanaerobaculia bacterium]|nr:glycosyltransferase family 39 protein [Thermoanaerobaculia bacterium]